MEFLSLGAGVQSTVLLLLAEADEVRPRPQAVIFVDTRWEPHDVYSGRPPQADSCPWGMDSETSVRGCAEFDDRPAPTDR